MSGIIHPAVEIVRRSVRLWDKDKERADMRAHLIVCRLIDAGFIEGELKGMMALLTVNDESERCVPRFEESGLKKTSV
jgi:hypothetical protein